MRVDNVGEAQTEANRMNVVLRYVPFQNLRTIADRLSKVDAFKMYNSAEQIARVLVGETTFCAMAGDPSPGISASLKTAEIWADCLAQERSRYVAKSS